MINHNQMASSADNQLESIEAKFSRYVPDFVVETEDSIFIWNQEG